MDKNIQERIEKCLRDRITLNFSDTLNKAFETFKGIWLYAGLGMLAISIINYIADLILKKGLGIISNIDPEDLEGITTPEEIFELYSELGTQLFESSNFYIYLVISIILSLLIIPLYAGIFKMAHNYDFNGKKDFSDWFFYFKQPYLGKILLAGLLVAVLTTIGTIFFILPGIYLMFAFSLIIPLIIFAKASVGESLGFSLKLMNKTGLVGYGLLIVAVIIGIAGLLICFIGLYFTLPFIHIMAYTIYKETVGFSEQPQEKEQFTTGYTS